MSTVRCINFLDLCRICTSSSEQKINIYSPDGRAKNLSHKISECLPVQIDEKDRLPKTVCAQCAQQLDQIYEMRNISLNSQTILNNWLNQRSVQSDDKVFIKDAINDTGKSLSVLGTPSGGISTSSSNNNSSSNQTNDLLSSIMQAMGMQVQQQPQQQQQQQQYTITVDSHVQAHPLSSQQSHSNHEAKSEKQNTLEEFIRLKPDIKIRPLGRKENLHNSPANSSNSNLKQQQQQHQQQQQQQQQPAQLQSQTLTAMPGPAAQLQLQPQQINELNVLLQQQALLQQLQQLQAQTQTQFISCNDDGMSASDSKKPKLNFVISSPSAAPQFTSSLAQFGNVGGGQPQIQLQLMSGNGGPGGTNTSSISASQPGQQLNAAALLSLAGTQLVGTNGTTNMLSPNKCFLPITIRDENSDQQIVAHIDTKNLVLPTTYQVQMKLQPQLATADGQPIMQLTPTSIPATLQLTPQTLGNANAFQTATTAHQSQFLVPQQLQQQQQHHQQHSQHLQPSTAQVTSQQIIRSPQSNAVNPQVVIRNISSEPGTPITITNAERSVTFKMPSAREQQRQQQQTKLKTTSNSNLFGATTVSTAVAPNADLGKRNTQLKQQANAGPSNVSALQRLSSNTTITKLPKQQQQPVAGNKLPLLNKQNITISRISTQVPPKSEPKSTITAQGQKQPQQQQPPKAQQQSQAGPPAPALVMQPLPATPAPSSSEPPAFPNILNQRKVIRKPPEVNPKTKVARPPQQILPVPVLLTKAVTQQQQQHQTQQVSNTAVTVLPITPSATPTASLTCPTCSREFKKKEHLTQHIKLHAGLRPFKCTEDGCDKAFSRKEHLSRHLVSHSGHKMFTCDECKKPFSRKDNLNKHKRTHSQSSETRVYSCEICNKNFASKQQYEKHREMHNNNKASSTQATAQQSNKAVFEVKQTGPTGQPTQSTQSEMQVQQHSQQLQPQIMHVDLDGSTITITQAPDSSMTNFVQLGYPQFQNSSGSTNQRVCKLEK